MWIFLCKKNHLHQSEYLLKLLLFHKFPLEILNWTDLGIDSGIISADKAILNASNAIIKQKMLQVFSVDVKIHLISHPHLFYRTRVNMWKPLFAATQHLITIFLFNLASTFVHLDFINAWLKPQESCDRRK